MAICKADSAKECLSISNIGKCLAVPILWPAYRCVIHYFYFYTADPRSPGVLAISHLGVRQFKSGRRLGERLTDQATASGTGWLHEVMILCGGRVIVNNIVGLRLIELLGLRGVRRFLRANGALSTSFFCNACANVRFTNRSRFWFAFRFCSPNPSGKTPRQSLGLINHGRSCWLDPPPLREPRQPLAAIRHLLFGVAVIEVCPRPMAMP